MNSQYNHQSELHSIEFILASGRFKILVLTSTPSPLKSRCLATPLNANFYRPKNFHYLINYKTNVFLYYPHFSTCEMLP